MSTSSNHVSGMLWPMANRSLSDVGGTRGGLGEFFVGFVMACVGGYLLFNQVTIAGSYWTFWGANSFGISLIPLLFGIGILFWNGRNPFGWLLTVGGLLFILAGVIANMHIYFPANQPVQRDLNVSAVGGRCSTDCPLDALT